MKALEVRGLSVTLPVEGARRRVLEDVTFAIEAGEALGLVGESGSGKSMTARSIARLLPAAAEVSGSVEVEGRDVWALRGRALRRHRRSVATVFQDPRAHINPVRSIGDFMVEGLRALDGVPGPAARRRAVAALEEVGVDRAAHRLDQRPHELSGGLLQRVMIAAMLLSEPRLILADEPTTALDVTTQSDVMAILDELRRDRGVAMLFITHDLDLAAAVCDRTAVMYAGEVMEIHASARLEEDPLHPYTAALAASRPPIDRALTRLAAIPGRPVSAYEAPEGCSFSTRCAHAVPRCSSTHPPLEDLGDGQVRCLRAQELRGRVLEGVRG